jgi:hypothetical protein
MQDAPHHGMDEQYAQPGERYEKGAEYQRQFPSR